MGRRERVVEDFFQENAKALGGGTRKWVSPGHDGVPDQLLFHPALPGRVWLVEVKASEEEDLRASQKREIPSLEALGCEVRVLKSKDQVRKFMAEILAEILKARRSND